MSAQPDAVLCRLAARGNVGAYDAIYQRYRQPVYAFVFHLLGRANGNEDAEDITQDVFTRAFAGIREQRLDGAFRGWLFTIARNRTFDEIRGGRQKVVSLDADNAEPPEAPQGEQPAEKAEQRAEFAWLMSAVADLPARQREALLLREMGGFSHERIAEELGTTVSATKKLISRGRDGVGVAAVSVGYKRRSRRRLGHDLAMAAPIVPISITLTSVGISSGAIAGGSAVIGGKAAATALTFLAIGGGAVAVQHDASKGQKSQGADSGVVAGPVRTERVATGLNGRRPELPIGGLDDRRSGEGRRGERDDSSARGTESEDRAGREGRDDSGRRGTPGGDRAEDKRSDDRDDDRSGRGGSGSGSSDSESELDDSIDNDEPRPASEAEDDGSHSGEGSGSEPESASVEDPETDSEPDDVLDD